MAINTNVVYSPNRDRIINLALKMIGAIGSGESLDDDTLQDCVTTLNDMIKAWEADGIHLFGLTEAILFPVLNQAKYSIDLNNGTANCTNTYNTTTLTASAIATATVLTIASNVNINNNDNIGIIDSTGAIQWATVVSSTSTTVTINTGLINSVVNGAYIYSYTSNINRPLKIRGCRSFDVTSNIDTDMI